MTQIYGSATLEKVAKQVGGIEKNFMNDALDASKGNEDLTGLPF
jgi:hypothetical protein